MERDVVGNACRLRVSTLAVVGVMGLALATAGCGDDDKSSQETYCEAGESLESSVAALVNLDLIAEGTDGLNAALDSVEGDLEELRDAASDAAADEVDALRGSVEELESSISTLGGEITLENVSALGTAVENVATSAQGVYTTLTDCP